MMIQYKILYNISSDLLNNKSLMFVFTNHQVFIDSTISIIDNTRQRQPREAAQHNITVTAISIVYKVFV